MMITHTFVRTGMVTVFSISVLSCGGEEPDGQIESSLRPPVFSPEEINDIDSFVEAIPETKGWRQCELEREEASVE